MTKINNISTGILIVCILCGVVTAATTISDTSISVESISVDNLILSGQTIVAYTAALNTKLSGIETLADVTDVTNVNSAGAVMESDIKDQSFTNLLGNGDFKSWSAGTAAAPDEWDISTPGISISRSSTSKIGSYATEVITTDTNEFLSQTIPNFEYYRGRKVTLGGWVKASTASAVSLRLYDTVGVSGSYHTGGGDWEWLTVTKEVSATATTMTPSCAYSPIGTYYFDGAILVEGSVCPPFSPKPLVDDGIMLQEHTPSSASDYGVTGQWCYNDEYIYVCNATDTWIRTSLTTW